MELTPQNNVFCKGKYHGNRNMLLLSAEAIGNIVITSVLIAYVLLINKCYSEINSPEWAH